MVVYQKVRIDILAFDLKEYENRSKTFEDEIKNLIVINAPEVNRDTREYLAKRIDILRLQYECTLLNRMNKDLIGK